ncbi:WD40-repeat-containing domain protein [Gorgonomyces haynaldii]|nr:WD40-repeat-containing domain protein [Gorgonomyces haynaldii]
MNISVPGWKLDNFIQPSNVLLDHTDPEIKKEIVSLIAQYLGDEGYLASKMLLLDEANIKTFERQEQIGEMKRMRKCLLEGEWAEVDRLCERPMMKNHKSFLYAVYKQQYLEYIDHQEMQKAFTHLNKRLKPLEYLQRTPTEFRDLCYLLTAKSVQDVPTFKNWEGIAASREKLVEMFQTMVDHDSHERDGFVHVPPNRLVELLRQAVAYQVESSRYHPQITPQIDTLMRDYTALIVPNAVQKELKGHTDSVKCVEFLGLEGRHMVSGSNDKTVRIWSTTTGECLDVLTGHTSRIWDLSCTRDGRYIASCSGDATIKIWDVCENTKPCIQTLAQHQNDVYSTDYHPTGEHLASAGYDKIVNLWDVERGQVAKTFSGHTLSVSRVIFSPLGNLIISGSKDATIRFWDIVSGLCIKTISSHLGEVTSVEMSPDGLHLLSSSKDNSNRLWDIRMLRPIRKFKGHQNTSKNFIRASFAGESLVVGGSEDGAVYIWDREKGDLLQRLRHHQGLVYRINWNQKQSMFVSCSNDCTLAMWSYDETKPLHIQ